MLSTESLKTLKYHTFSIKTLVVYIICSKCENEYEKIFKEEESMEILKILGLIKIYIITLKKHGWRKHKPRI